MMNLKQRPNPNYLFLKQAVPLQRISLLQGSTRSGKTYSVIDYIINLCTKHTGMEIDICRDTYAALKDTAWKDFKKRLVQFNLYDQNYHNKTDKSYILNGNMICYYGADEPGKIHGRSRDLLWINEAHTFSEEVADQLLPRTRYRIICDYNPDLIEGHWLDKYIDKFPPFISTYLDNPFLTADQIADIESRKGNDWWWTVYGTGQRCKPTGLIYKNWDKGVFDDSLPFVFGLDFGYNPDPTALVKVAVDNKKKLMYAKEFCYATNLSEADIKQMIAANTRPDELIIADGAEQRVIDAIRDEGFNIYDADKGPGSIRAGILYVMDYKIISCESPNLEKELNRYKWNDKRAAIPIDKHNHLLDAMRYGCEQLRQPEFFFG